MTRKNQELKIVPRRHTHSVIASYEDALAIMNELILEVAETLKYIEARVNQAREIVKTARKGPHAYDADRPAGVRIRLRRKGKE